MAITNASRVADFGSGIGTEGAVLQVDNTNERIGIGTNNPQAMLQVGTAVTVYGNSGIVSATSYYGSGANLTGISVDSTALKDSNDVVRVQANTSGAVVTGIVTATTFIGNLTGDVTGDVTGDASGSSGSCTGNAASATLATNASGLSGSPDITINNLVGVAATFSGVVTYEDVTNIDSVGIVTARTGVKVLAGGINAVGVSTFSGSTSFTGGLAEKYENAGTTLGAQTNNPISDGNIILFTGNESSNNTINFTGVHAVLSSGETVSFTAILTPNNSGVINVVQVDGQAITVKWSGGSAPTAGASGQDIYTFQILKTGSGTSDYTVFGAAANYA